LAGVREDARDSRRMSDLNQINLAMEMYKNNIGTYINTTPGTDTVAAIGDYLAVVPADPVDNGTYGYVWLDGETTYYCLYALLEGTDATTYYCSSNEGTASDTTSPTLLDCCNHDLTD
jgi:type II secretory pathway pseudopilin PulG